MKIGLIELHTAIREVVEEYGEDYIYNTRRESGGKRCVYVNESGQPSCLIGKALFKLGVPLEDLASFDGDYEGDALGAVDLPVFSPSGDYRSASWFAQLVQNAQDSGQSWGEALKVGEVILSASGDLDG